MELIASPWVRVLLCCLSQCGVIPYAQLSFLVQPTWWKLFRALFVHSLSFHTWNLAGLFSGACSGQVWFMSQHLVIPIYPLCLCFPLPHPYELSPDFDWFLGFDQCLQIRINFWTSCILLCISLSKSFSQKIGWKDRVNNWRCEMVTNFWWILSLRMLKENGKKAWILSLHLQSIERRQICTGQCYHDLTWIHQKPTPELLCFVMTEWNELLCKIQAALFYWLGVLQIGKFCDSFLQKCSSIAMLLMPGLSTATERQEFQSHKVWFVATSDR